MFRFIVFLPLLFLPFAQGAEVKRSDSLICHDVNSPWYTRTKRYVAYDSLEDCLNSGGRLRKGAKPVFTPQQNEVSENNYKRDYFGSGWADFDHDCHDTRAEVLASLSTSTVTYRTNGCTVDRGKWVSMFTNKEYYQAKSLDVDHIVPLALAWERGAYAWSEDKRLQFANDLTNLVPVEASLNREKGAKSIGQWLPPLNKCEYVFRFARVSLKYGLSLTSDDERVLRDCKSP